MGTLVVCGHGRRTARPTRTGARRAAAQHPDADRAHRRDLLELRERELLPVRVHAHVHAHRARDRRGRRARRRRCACERVAAFRARADRGARGLVVEVRHARGNPQPARGARPLGTVGRRLTLAFAPSYAVLCLAQAATVAAPARQATGRSFGAVWLLVPAGLLAAGVLILDFVSAGPRALALLATFGTPVLAAGGGALAGSRRWWLWPPLAAGLWVAAWLAHGLVQDAAGLALIALACLAAASAAGRVAPATSIRAGLVALAALDVVLVWATPEVKNASNALETVSLPHAAGVSLPALQQATFGSALMGWLDLLAPALLVVAGRTKYGAAVATGVAAGLWGLLFFVTPEVAATVPVLAGLAFATADARRRRL